MNRAELKRKPSRTEAKQATGPYGPCAIRAVTSMNNGRTTQSWITLER
ncbi:MAG: hypothetical protein HQL74_15890 [Magnetococcales bacterium]|nr:hypothetical protein [Magnetococcales bacterium]